MTEECPDCVKLEMDKREKEERKESDKKYALKIVEVIVFSGIAVVLLGALSILGIYIFNQLHLPIK